MGHVLSLICDTACRGVQDLEKFIPLWWPLCNTSKDGNTSVYAFDNDWKFCCTSGVRRVTGVKARGQVSLSGVR